MCTLVGLRPMPSPDPGELVRDELDTRPTRPREGDAVILGTSDVGGGREKAGREPVAARRNEKLVPSIAAGAGAPDWLPGHGVEDVRGDASWPSS